MKILSYIGLVLWLILLTLLTQLGGLVWLLCLPIFTFLNKKIKQKALFNLLKISIFCFFYWLVCFKITPSVSPRFGRVPMPYGDENPNLRPVNFITILANRHYVTPDLKAATEGVVQKMIKKFEDDSMVVNYLDCNFPFFDGFPLEPHLSHNDGRKMDLAFQYLDAKTQKPTAKHPARLGYGVCEEPRAGEENRAEYCREQGEWQYSFMKNYVVSQRKKADFTFDAVRTREMMRFFITDSRVQMLLIEPHLKKRLGLERETKIRLHPCKAVRHDDHIHVAVY